MTFTLWTHIPLSSIIHLNLKDKHLMLRVLIQKRFATIPPVISQLGSVGGGGMCDVWVSYYNDYNVLHFVINYNQLISSLNHLQSLDTNHLLITY